MCKPLCILAAAVTAAVLATGCLAPTRTVVMSYDADGRITSKTETSESVAKTIADATRGKNVFLGESGWRAYVSATLTNTDDVAPSIKAYAGKSTRWYLSTPNPTGTPLTDEVVASMTRMVSTVAGETLSVTASGISAGGQSTGSATESKSVAQ